MTRRHSEDINFTEMQTGLQKMQYYSLCGLGKTIHFLGIKTTYALADGFAFLAWHILRSRRENTIASIREHLKTPQDEARNLAYKSFQSTFRSFTEILFTEDFGLEHKGTHLFIENEELWEKLRSCQRPIVAATGHYGSWELLASLLGQVFQPPRPRMVVVRKYPNPAVHAFISKQREARGASMIGHRAVATSVLRALRKHGIVAFLVDHKTKNHEAYTLPFLGDMANVNMGPALLAVRAEALVLPIFLERTDKGFLLHLQEPLDTKLLSGTTEEKIKETTLFYTRAMEKQIRSNPEQWFWMHNRWNKDWK